MQIGFFGILTLLFVVAKLAGAIDWSWWLVFAPAIFGGVLGFVFTLFIIIFSLNTTKN